MTTRGPGTKLISSLLRYLSSGWGSVCVVLLLVLLIAAACSPSIPGQAPGEPEFSFVVLGDNQPNGPNEPQPAIFEKMLEQIKSLEPPPALVINTGDIVYGETPDKPVSRERWREQYEEFLAVASKLKVPMYIVPGNHELSRLWGQMLFLEYFPKGLYYSFDYLGAHFIVITFNEYEYENRLSPQQREWLEQDLKRSGGAEHLFVLMHQPLIPYLLEEQGSIPENVRNDLLALFSEYHVSAIFTGHEHLYHETAYKIKADVPGSWHTRPQEGVRQYITGGAGAPLHTSLAKGGYHHFLIVQVRGKYFKIKVVKLS